MKALDAKTGDAIYHKQMGAATNKSKVNRDVDDEIDRALYKIPGKRDRYGIPASGIKKMLVNTGKFVGLDRHKGFLNGAFHILAGPGNLVELNESKWEVDRMMGRNPNAMGKPAVVIFRPRFDKWSIDIKIMYNANIISTAEIANLFENAGFSVGLCEFRPEKGGSYGMFKLAA